MPDFEKGLPVFFVFLVIFLSEEGVAYSFNAPEIFSKILAIISFRRCFFTLTRVSRLFMILILDEEYNRHPQIHINIFFET